LNVSVAFPGQVAELHFYQLLGVDGPVPVSRKKKKMICTCTFYAVSYWTLAKKIGASEATDNPFLNCRVPDP
jgi:hypothetical protein